MLRQVSGDVEVGQEGAQVPGHLGQPCRELVVGAPRLVPVPGQRVVVHRGDGERVVLDDRLLRHPGQRQQERGHQTGPVPTCRAVDDDRALRGVRDGADGRDDEFRPGVEVRTVVLRRVEHLAPARHELAVLPHLDGAVVPRDAGRQRQGRDLVRVAQVDDRPHPRVDQLRPALLVESVQARGAEDAPRARDGRAGGQTSEVARVVQPAPGDGTVGHASRDSASAPWSSRVWASRSSSIATASSMISGSCVRTP